MRPRVISSRTGTRDLQTVTISLRVLSRPIPENLPEIFRQLGEDWDERVRAFLNLFLFWGCAC